MKKEPSITQSQYSYKYMLTVTEAAAAFGIGIGTLRDLIRNDETFPVIKVGTHNKINSGLLKDWLDKATAEKRNI